MNLKFDKEFKEKFLISLEKNLGIVSIACRECNVSRGAYYHNYNNDKEFKVACDEINEVTLDFGEAQLLKNMRAGDTTSTIFFLKTKGKKRGYNERNETLNVNVQTSDTMTKEQLELEIQKAREVLS